MLHLRSHPPRPTRRVIGSVNLSLSRVASAPTFTSGGPDGAALSRRSTASLPGISKAAPVQKVRPHGVSVAFLRCYLAEHHPDPEVDTTIPDLVLGFSGKDEGESLATSRTAALALKRRMQEVGQTGSYVDVLGDEEHFMTGGAVAGRTSTHVVHAWDSPFRELVAGVAGDARGDLDRRYGIDVFAADLLNPPADPVATVQGLIAGAGDVLLVLDSEGKALNRLWVLFEVFLAQIAGKLRVRCAASSGFGSSQASLRAWESRIDSIDWVLAETTRSSDDKRLRKFAEFEWEMKGRGVERMLVQLKKFLRSNIYGQILVNAVEAGDRMAVETALDLGADPCTRDHLGNPVEDLASFNGRGDIEKLLFERRMQKMPHLRLSAFFNPQELADSDQAEWFFTEVAGETENISAAVHLGDEDPLHLSSAGFSEQSTRTPHLSSRSSSKGASGTMAW
mmetsp:Transcript_106665/g.188867  ORF Transcript_106665/g.188867 Transcript_106665/m.188867 type:complete len:451 (-) Transcript_106665:129-1481(-)